MWANGTPATLDDFLSLLLKVYQDEARRSLEKLNSLKEKRDLK